MDPCRLSVSSTADTNPYDVLFEDWVLVIQIVLLVILSVVFLATCAMFIFKLREFKYRLTLATVVILFIMGSTFTLVARPISLYPGQVTRILFWVDPFGRYMIYNTTMLSAMYTIWFPFEYSGLFILMLFWHSQVARKGIVNLVSRLRKPIIVRHYFYYSVISTFIEDDNSLFLKPLIWMIFLTLIFRFTFRFSL